MWLRKFMLVCAGVLSALVFISEAKSEEPVVVEGKILVRYESSLSAQEIETIEIVDNKAVSQKITLETDKYPKGVYLLRFRHKNGEVETRKIIKI
jgi:hypothetical protein